MTEKVCRIPDCYTPAARGDLCWAHLKRQQRGASLTTERRDYGKSRWEALLGACYVMAEVSATDADAYRRAKVGLQMAAFRYVLTWPSVQRRMQRTRKRRPVR